MGGDNGNRLAVRSGGIQDATYEVRSVSRHPRRYQGRRESSGSDTRDLALRHL